MADSVSTILDYLRQHHFLEAEAALKAELAGREVSNGLFPIDVDLGIRSVQENVEKLVLGDFPDESKPDKLKAVSKAQETEVRQAGGASQLFDLSCKEVKRSEGPQLESRTEQTDSLEKSAEHVTANSLQKPSEMTVGEAQEASEINKRADGTNGKMDLSEDFIKDNAGISTTRGLNETFWEQKDELLWVASANKQGPQLGKVHPLDEPGLRALQKHKTSPAVVLKEDLGNSVEKIELQAPPETAGRNLDAELAAMNKEDRTPTRAEGLPRLPPVRLKSAEKVPDEWMPHCKFNTNVDVEADALEGPYGLGAYLDVPVGQDISSSGTKRSGGSNRPSVSHGIVEDPSDLLAFATVADDYPDEYWDSDDYEDDDDPGYTRRPVEDEATFLAGEVSYPSEEDKARAMEGVGQAGTAYGKYEDDDRSFVESYFSGEEYYKSRETGDTAGQVDRNADFQHGKDYDGQLLDLEELKQIRAEPAWQGFVVQGSAAASKDQVVEANPGMLDLDPDDLSREIRETYLAESSGEGETQDCDLRAENCYELPGFGGVHYSQANSREGGFRDIRAANAAEEEDIILQYYSRTWVENAQANGCEQFTVSELQLDRNLEPQLQDEQMGGFQFGGFSFPSPSSGGEVEGSRAESGRSLWSARDISSRGEDADHFANGFVGPDDTLASWKRKSNDSSPVVSPGEDHDIELPLSTRSTCSARSSDVLSVDGEPLDDEVAEVQREDTEAAAFDEEAIAVHEHFQRLQAEEDEFETFDLKIVHRKNRTGFEEEKDFPVVINSVIAGRYHVTEYLGSAAFSKAIQAHDLHTGMDVCMKIIKNNKDFFDQSLDEIKLLKYINKHDPADKYHILRLYDYFYHREHLFIVCELLRANLYEFHKYNRDSGGEVYFTMPRLQSIARQCLEALEFLHSLGLIHCDLKPENILVKSYSRCEVKVIDLGSSCFQSDHLCSYVQSRSYRAPEVILGLPYDQKIDIWSLGCILAELCSGNVLFQNDSLATLLARVVGIVGPLDPEMVAKGRDSFKYLTRNNMLYDRNQETNRIEYLIPKKTTLAHRLPMGDQGFVEFVRYLLQINPKNRPTASEALKHAWLSFPYEPISS